MKPCVVLIAGMPASGKTTYGERLAQRLKLPFFSKDIIKERLYDAVQYDTAERENARKYGSAAYNVCWYVAEAMMKAGGSFLLESNFTPDTAPILEALIQKYGYKALTVLLDGEIPVLHRRFCDRDGKPERHPGLKSTSGVFEDYNYFRNAVLPTRSFSVGERVVINTTDFTAADYERADRAVDAFIKEAGMFVIRALTEEFRP